MTFKFKKTNKTVAFLSILSLFFSCDDDIIDVGSDTVISNTFDIVQTSDFTIELSQLATNSVGVQSNNLNHYLLGSFDQGFGQEPNHILTQYKGVSVAIEDSYTVGTSQTTDVSHSLTKAELVLPFSYELTSDSDTERVYSIESTIIGDELKVALYQSNFEINNTNLNSNDDALKKYYSSGTDGTIDVPVENITTSDNLISSSNIDLSVLNNSFTINKQEESETLTNEELAEQFNAIRIDLSNVNVKNQEDISVNFLDYLNQLLREGNEDSNNDDSTDLSTDILENDTITSVFKGIYITIEDDNEDAYAEILGDNTSFVEAGIQLTFQKTSTINSENSEPQKTTEKILTTWKLTENPIKILEEPSEDIIQDETQIVLKSGLGSVATLNLFSNEELTSLYEDNILLNEAVLQFTVDEDFYTDNNIDLESLPENIFITNLETGNVLVDYLTHFDSSDTDSLKEGHMIPKREEAGHIVYEFNITSHLSNILEDRDYDLSDHTDLEELLELNTTLSLSVTKDISLTETASLFNTIEEQAVNQGSLLCFNTVAICDSNNIDTNKRPKLTLTYTKTIN